MADADVSLAHAIASADDTGYDALADQSVTVSITEDDVVGVTINPTTLSVTEGDATGIEYTVVLTSKPAEGRDGDDQRPCQHRREHHQRRAERRRRADLHHGQLEHGPDGDGEGRP